MLSHGLSRTTQKVAYLQSVRIPRFYYGTPNEVNAKRLSLTTRFRSILSSAAFCAVAKSFGRVKNGTFASLVDEAIYSTRKAPKETAMELRAAPDLAAADGSEGSVVIVADLYRNGSSQKIQSVEIVITKEESELFNLLRECLIFSGLKIELRVAGGWVRDKLLRVASKDIDIALEHITGVEFCNHLNAFTEKSRGFHKTVGIVKRRPEQSKHLETATLNILGLNVDFVNLRSEDYAENSRIPVMKIGTPLEDAMRRDFTINSLFYNISTNTIEDHTGKGIEDLNAQIIRTCSPAFSTFMDDPLRVIRAARFSARLGYRLDDEIVTASSNPQVLYQLEHKVAKARIAQELDDMLSRGDTPMAFELMKLFGVLPILVRERPRDTPSDRQIDSGCKTMVLVRECLKCLKWNQIDRKLAYIAAFCSPLKGEATIDKCTCIEHVIKSRLRLPNKVASGANTIVEGSEEFAAVLSNLPLNIEDLREALGAIVRRIGPLWKEALLLSMASEAFDNSTITPDHLTQKYSDVEIRIHDLNLQDAYSLKAPITGKELMDLLPGLKPGPQFKEALDFQIKQLLRSPSLSKQELVHSVTNAFKDKV
ncbi:tRNA nucleotidyltransferase [Babesia caballi]|uniref:tRNA nucleotidyltransferase n=1 Tax=Babesia caballi TaxID=5871 RepID=A0AAV4LXZ7_BABCB|nr:tRNA nucleotidyltransferase [Babesia caballi]